MVKRSVSLDDDVAERVAEAAADEGVSFSTWLTAAARHQLVLRAGRTAVADYEAEHGALTESEQAEGRRILDDMLDRAAGQTTGAIAS